MTSSSTSARRGQSCDMCVLLWRCLQELLGDNTLEFYRRLVFKNVSMREPGPMRGYLDPRDPDKIRKIRLQFYTNAGDGESPQ
jgi:hypothetical protein